jgi:hypothetical protein
VKKNILCVSFIAFFSLNTVLPSEITLTEVIVKNTLPLEITLTESVKIAAAVFRNFMSGVSPIHSLRGQGLSNTLDAAGVFIYLPQRITINMCDSALLDVVQLSSDAFFKFKIGCLTIGTVTGFLGGYQCGKFVGWACGINPKNRKVMGWCFGIPCGLLSFVGTAGVLVQGR